MISSGWIGRPGSACVPVDDCIVSIRMLGSRGYSIGTVVRIFIVFAPEGWSSSNAALGFQMFAV